MNKTARNALIALALVAALVCGFLTGCGTPASPGGDGETTRVPPAQDTGLTLNIFQPHQSRAALWEELAADYKALTGVTVAVRTSNTAKPATELKEAFKEDEGAPCLFFFTNPREHAAWKDNAADLIDTAAYQRLADRRLALTVNDQVVGLPLAVEAYGIIYNKKILNEYFNLSDKDTSFTGIADITSYKELDELVKDLAANKATLGLDGVFAAPAYKEGESAAWSTRLLSVPVGYEMEQRKLGATGEEINRLDLRYETGYHGFYDLHKGYGTTNEGLENRSYADAVREFATGRAALVLGGTDFLGHLNSAVGRTVEAEDIAFLPAFMNIEEYKAQGLAFEVTEYAAINGKADQEKIKAAGEFLNWLVTSERGMDFLVNKLGLTAPYDNIIENAPPVNALAADALGWLRKSEITNAVTYGVLSPGEEFRDKVLGTGLYDYHRGENTWDRFKADLSAGWETHRARMEENW